MVVSKNLKLRKLEEADIPTMVEWMSDPTYAYFLSGTPLDSEYQLSQRLRESIEAARYPNFLELYLIVENNQGEPLGFIRMGSINWISRNYLLDIMIGKNHHRNRGIGIEALLLVVSYAFFELHMFKLYAFIYEFNKKFLNILDRIGLEKEGTLREFIYIGGQYHNVIVMGGVKDELVRKYKNSPRLKSFLRRFNIFIPE